jgi:hypothetical protein
LNRPSTAVIRRSRCSGQNDLAAEYEQQYLRPIV